MGDREITVLVKLFAAYQEAFGVTELRLAVPSQTRVCDILENLILEHPELAQWQDLTRFGVNLQMVPPETRLHEGDEVVLIPPVSGG